jgi:hypothetical protein
MAAPAPQALAHGAASRRRVRDATFRRACDGWGSTPPSPSPTAGGGLFGGDGTAAPTPPDTAYAGWRWNDQRPPPIPRRAASSAAAAPPPAAHSAFQSGHVTLNLIGKIEGWGIGPATRVADVSIKVSAATGAQLKELLRKLPEGMTFELNLEKEED